MLVGARAEQAGAAPRVQSDFEDTVLVALHVELVISGKIFGLLHADLWV